MKFNALLNNFTSGLWSKKMVSRADTEEYFKACEELKNMLPQLQGGAFRRPGSVWKNLDTFQSKLQSGDYSRTIPYRTADGNKYILFCKDGNPTGVGVEWFMLNVSTMACTNITAPLDANIPLIGNTATMSYTQVGDLLYLCFDGHYPRVIYVPAAGTFSMVPFDRIRDVLNISTSATGSTWEAHPFGPVNALDSGGTLTVTGTFTVGGVVTITSNAGSVPRFLPNDGNAGNLYPSLFIKVSKGSVTGVIKVGFATGVNTATGLVYKVLPGASGEVYGSAAGTSFEMSQWSASRGWPRTVVSHEQRIYWGGTLTLPDTIWGSRAGAVYDLMEVPLQDDPEFATFATDNSRPWQAGLATSSESYKIQSMAASKTLEIHTERQDIVAYGGNGQILGPLNKVFQSSTSFGAAYVQPKRVNNFSTFVQRGGKKLRDVTYSFDEDQYKSTDLGFMADHLVQGTTIKKLESMEFMQTSLLLALKADGKLMSCSVDRDYKMNAWSEWEFTSAYGNVIKDICVVPGDGPNGEDAMYFLWTRTISGVPVSSLEKLYTSFEGDAYDFYGSGDQMYYLDSITQAVNGTAPTANTIHSVGRLNGETVSVVADGYYVGDKLVDGSGNITLDKPAVRVMVGMKYKSRLVPMAIQAGAQYGTPMSQVKAAARATFNFFKTLACKYRVVGTNDWTQIQFRKPSVPSNQLTPVFTGDQTLSLPPALNRKYQIEFETDTPYPMNINSIVLEGVTFD